MATKEDYSRSVISASDELKDIFCEPCEHDGKQLEAEGFCVDCSEYLCGQCYKNHKRHKAFRHHVLQDKDNMPQNAQSSQSAVKDTCLQKCTKHLNETISFFCWSCDLLGCSTCILLDHRQCKGVCDIPTLVKAQKTQEELVTFIKKVNTMSEQIQERKNQIKSVLNTADDLRKATKTELEQQHTEINKYFNDLKKEMDKKVDQIHESNEEVLTAASKRYDSLGINLTNLKTNIDKKYEDGQNCEAFIAMKYFESDMKTLETGLENVQTDSKIEIYEFVPSAKIKDIIKNKDEIYRLQTKTLLLDAGILESRDKQQFHMPTLSSANQNTVKDKTKTTSLKLEMEINVSTVNDKECPYVRGITEIHGHYIVVADNNNKSVKVIDTRNETITSEINLEGSVWNVTSLNNGQIAVAQETGIQLLSVSKSGSLTKDSVICNEQLCFDLADYEDTLIAAQGGSIKLFDMDGNTVKSFVTNSGGERLFQNCFGLAISPDNETIYASDFGKNTVTSMTMEGKVNAIYKDSELGHPWGITVNNEGYVYVCSTSTNSIHRLSAECKKLEIIQNVSAGCLTCTDKNKLLAGGYQSLWVYDIE